MRKLYTYGPTDFFACSEDAGRYTFGNKKFKVIYNAIDIDKFLFDENKRNKIRKELNLENKFVVGNIGRLHEQKNQSFLIDVFNLVHIKNKDAILIIVGNGPLEQELKEKVKKLNLESSVKFLGTRKDVDSIYQAMDVFVLPSLFEGLGIVAIEAQASGLPVIASTGVAKEANITKNIKNISLDDKMEKWAKEICNAKVENRLSIEKQVRSSGFDVKENAKFFEKFYTDKINSGNEKR